MNLLLKAGLAISAALHIAGAAIADGSRLQMPANPPAVFVNECASCHMAFSPRLLPAESWNRVMNGLSKHYGVDASLTDSQATEIRRWLTANAANGGKQSTPPPEDRITKSAWFIKKHHEISPATWARASIKSAANCAACHSQAEKGLFDERHIRIPK